MPSPVPARKSCTDRRDCRAFICGEDFMGITGAAVGINNAVQEAIARRLMERQQAFKNSLELRSADRLDREQALSEQLRRDQLAETTRQHDALEQDRNIGRANAL